MFTVNQILDSTGGKLIGGSLRRSVSGVSIDSRTIKRGELFIAIKGSRFDGHAFIAEARKRGAAALVFSNGRYRVKLSGSSHLSAISIIKVKDTVLALAALAYSYRKRFTLPVIAITGSNGKTTTKEMLKSILSKKFNVLSSPGTENNHIGVPLTILRLRKKHNIAVLEMGANHAGEIDRLSWILQPTVGIITNIGSAHLEFFKTLQGVLETKLELTKNLSKDGKLVINQDDPLLGRISDGKNTTLTFGLNPDSNFHAQDIKQSEDKISFVYNKKHHVELKTLGRHNVYNALASIAVANSFNVDCEAIRDALLDFQAPPMRMQIVKLKNSIRVINDCYNANPASFNCALDFLKECANKGKKIVICADMLELGEKAKELHLEIGRKIAQIKVDFLITIGTLAEKIASGAKAAGMAKESIKSCHSFDQITELLPQIVKPNDLILLKGSRAMQMEKMLKCFMNSSIH